MDKTEILWKQYSQNVDLFKFYMKLVLELNVFYYAVTGAIFSFYFANHKITNIQYSLMLPLFMSLAFAGFFFYGAHLMKCIRQEVFDIRDNLGLKVAPDVGVLSLLLRIFAVLFIIVAIVCVYIVFFVK
ncbi:MAG: hypothetical protein WC632_04805 [Candidatus Margulisiibacteriota bacterium]